MLHNLRPFRPNILTVALAVFSLWSVTSCGAPKEAPRVRLPVVVDGSGVTSHTTDLGYKIDGVSVRMVLRDIAFTVAGEAHTTSLITDLLVPDAQAHPGHYEGGEVTGELPGSFVVSWPEDDGRELGVATLIATTYNAANFVFGRGSAEHLGAEDPLVGHTAMISGTASRDGYETFFTITLDAPQARKLIGAPFEATLRANATGALKFRFNAVDALEGDSVFDGIDFASLPGDTLDIMPGITEAEDAYNTFRRTFLTHDHYNVEHHE